MKSKFFLNSFSFKIIHFLIIFFIFTQSNFSNINSLDIEIEKTRNLEKNTNLMLNELELTKRSKIKHYLKDYPSLTAVGTASREITTDNLRIGIQINSKNTCAEQALKDNTSISNRVTEALLRIRVPKKNISTVNFTLLPLYNLSADPLGKKVEQFDGYIVSNYIEVITSKIFLAGKIIDNAVGIGASSINYVKFEILNETIEAVKTDLIEIAVRDAGFKAMQALYPLNYKIDEVAKVVIDDFTPIAKLQDVFTHGLCHSTLFNNKKKLTAKVTVTFYIKEKKCKNR